jgi:ribosomal RNA-processing protein 9
MMKKRAALRQVRPSSNLRGKKGRSNSDGNVISLKWKKRDEEISSDEDDSEEDKHSNKDSDIEDEDSNIVETAEEKRRRLARGYLQQMGSLIQKDDDDDECSQPEDFDAHLSEHLKRDRLQRKGKYYREFAEHFESMNLEEITFRHLYGHSSSITAVALTTDETSIFTGSKDNSIVKWDTETGQKQELKRKWSRTEDVDKQCHEGEVLSVAVSSDGRYVVGGGKDSWIRVYDKRSKYAEVHVFKNHKESISGLVFQTDTYALFSSSQDRCIKYWDLNEMGYIETLFGHQVISYGLAKLLL